MTRRPPTSELLDASFGQSRHLCVGLDTDLRRIPSAVLPDGDPVNRVVAFNTAIIDATADIAGAYKPNIAFYEGLGSEGWIALAQTVASIRQRAPSTPVILDAKRGDIGSSNVGYVTALFDALGGDAVTVHPYFGRESLEPFLSAHDRVVFVIARSSNPGASEFQDLEFSGIPLYRHVARAVANDWNDHGNCGLVVGATYADELALLRDDVPTTMPFLIPGVGHQRADVSPIVAAHRRAGSNAFLINASRSIIYASADDDFAQAANDAARNLHQQILDVDAALT